MKSATPYHAGEIAAQNKAGTRGAAAELAAVMTDSLNFSSNHDEFLAARKFSVLTSVDSVSGDVWVTPLFGKNGDLDADTNRWPKATVACLRDNCLKRHQ